MIDEIVPALNDVHIELLQHDKQPWVTPVMTAVHAITRRMHKFRDELAAVLALPEAPAESHEHDFAEFVVCRQCLRTPADVSRECHHCGEVEPGKRCWWCLRLRVDPSGWESHGSTPTEPKP